ncbi:hypothetical protein SCLARK_00969 [Spiroplasma clarkii]|nr:hypothetical protein SCLARK_00969 [Spiroplasma clarkii]
MLEDVITELSSIHRQLNEILFDNKLVQVKIAVENNKRQSKSLMLGHFNPNDGWLDGNKMQISIWTLALNGDYYELIGILVHEMIHQYNYQNGIKDVENNQRHNKKFKTAAISIGKLYIEPTIRGSKTNAHGKGYAYTKTSKELRQIIDKQLDFNKAALQIKHKYAIVGDQRGYEKRNKYTCSGCKLVITSSRSDLSLLCLNCCTLIIKTDDQYKLPE